MRLFFDLGVVDAQGSRFFYWSGFSWSGWLDRFGSVLLQRLGPVFVDCDDPNLLDFMGPDYISSHHQWLGQCQQVAT